MTGTAKNYKRGRAKEYYQKDKLERAGLLVIRSAGSHSFADLIAIDRQTKRIRFIQCKPKKFNQQAQDKLLKSFAWLFDEFLCSYEIVGGKNAKKDKKETA